MLPLNVRLVARVRATPFSSHPPPVWWLSREMPALGHSDRCKDDTQHDGPHEVKGQEGHSCDLQGAERIDDLHGGYETHVHEYRHEQAAISTLVDPHHEHPEGNQE